MARISSIDITFTQATYAGVPDSNKFKISFYADIKPAPPGVHFYARLEGLTVNPPLGYVDLTYEQSGIYQLTDDFAIDKAKNTCQLQVCTDTTFTQTEDNIFAHATVLLTTFTNLKAIYGNDKINLTFNTPSAISYGVLNIGGDLSICYTLPDYSKGYTLSLPRDIYGDSSQYDFSITPYIKNTVSNRVILSCGPDSLSIRAHSDVATIKSVQKNDDNLVIYADIPTVYQDENKSVTDFTACIALVPRADNFDKKPQFKNIAIGKDTTPSSELYIITVNITDYHDIDDYSAYLYIQSKGGEPTFQNLDITQSNNMTLYFPKIDVISKTASADATLTFDYPANSGITSIKVSAKGQNYVVGKSILFQNVQTLFNEAISVTPQSLTKSGLVQNVSVFKKGYYLIDGQLNYIDVEGNYTDKSHQFDISPSFFATVPLSAPIVSTGDASTSGALTVPVEANKITIDASKSLGIAEYNDFIAKLFANNVTAEGYYTIRNIIARNAVLSKEKYIEIAEHIQLGLRLPSGTLYKTADIFPGSVLRVRSSEFLRLPSAEANDNTQGYLQSSEIDYLASLSEDGTCICFDKTLDNLVGAWSELTRNEIQPPTAIFASAYDFFNAHCKTPYMRIFCPNDGLPLSGSDEKQIVYFNNMTLRCGNTLVSLNDDELSSTRPSVPYIAFRGRSIITTCINVSFKGSVFTIPSGTTIKDFASRFGVYDLSSLALSRRNGRGELVPVFASLPSIVATLKDIPLISGDVMTEL